jgi:hypothetical protein
MVGIGQNTIILSCGRYRAEQKYYCHMVGIRAAHTYYCHMVGIRAAHTYYCHMVGIGQNTNNTGIW